jgi:hypothetical protein
VSSNKTVCFTDIDQGSKLIHIFESILVTYTYIKRFLEAAGAVAKVGSSLKLNHSKQMLPA